MNAGRVENKPFQKLVPSWLSNSWGVAWGIAGIYLLFYILWTLFHWGATESFRLIPQWDVDKNFAFITDLAFQPLSLFAAITAWRVAINSRLDARLRRAWLLLGLAMASQFIGDSIWFYLEVVLGEQPYPAVSDIFYFSFYPLALFGLLSLPGAHLSTEERGRVLLDLAIVMIVAWMITWFLIISPTAAQYENGQLDQILSAAYPISDLVVTGGALFLLFRKNTSAMRSVLLVFLIGLILFITADMLFAYISVAYTYEAGGLIDVFWITAFLVFALAALMQADTTSSPTMGNISERVLASSSITLPFVAILLGYGMLIYVASNSSSNSTEQGVFIGAGLLTIFVIGRQAVVARQNEKLFKEAQQLRVAAEQANTAKSAFLATMSHELRTPLNAILGFTRIVRRKSEGLLPEKQIENLDKVLSSGEHLLGLINTVLDIAKIEAGRMDVQASNFSINALAEQCANIATPLIKPNVTLEKNLDPGLQLVYSDQDKIKQIILNLLSNAAKFTHEGSVRLNIRHTDSVFMLDIGDSGIGMAEEALGRIFQEFQQADSSTTRKYGGTGLGLAISRNLARLLGGDLTVTSKLGVGSTFTLSLPIHYAGKQVAPTVEASIDTKSKSVSSQLKPAAADQTQSTKKIVLVIDDDPDAVYLLQENLGQSDYEVVGARDGITGHQKAREIKPHAILLDIMMPDKDGWQVLHDLKADPLTAGIPVILLTIIDKKALGFKLGASAYLLKPLDPVAVLDALKSVTRAAGRNQTYVLVVDDDPLVADLLKQILPASEFAITSANDGIAGLEIIQQSRPDVVLLDLMMPHLDGFGVIEQLRSDPSTQELPIIVISAKELTDDESRKLRESVTFVMKKQGFDGERLVHEIKTALEK
jgi:signal transduction histidine kinase/CheY-like chemotaxis protein